MKRFLFYIPLFCLLLLVGCKEKIMIEPKEVVKEPEVFRYQGTEKALAMTVDEEGLVYTATVLATDTQEITTSKEELREHTQRFCVYDLEGTCIQQVDVLMGNSNIAAMTIKGNTLYAIASRLRTGQVLYAVDLTTWEVTKVAVLAEQDAEDFYRIENILCIEEYLYILGWTQIPKEYELRLEVSEFKDNKILGRISLAEENASMEVLDVDFPLAILPKESTLLIYQYNEEYGFGFLEYNPKEESFKEVGEKSTKQIPEGFCLCEEGYLFTKGATSALYYGTFDGMEAQIGTKEFFLYTAQLQYRNGFVFYYNYRESQVERVRIEGSIQDNKEIRLLINSNDVTHPYGVGYRMIRKEVNREEFSLKVLAQDADFDLYLLGSRDSNAYNLKKNGVFYPLNDIPAIERYLDACFPYLKEIATNEDGDIWMVPVRVDIPILLYDKVYSESQGIDFSNMSYLDFLAFTERVEREDAGKIGNYKIQEEFFAQYFRLEDSFDTDVFREYAKQIKSLYNFTGESIASDKVYKNDILPEFYYEYVAFYDDCIMFSESIERWELEETVGVIKIPKMSEELNNLGTCYFFAVNPQSDNLETTLTYLSDLCTYLMGVENSFLLADATTYTENAFIQQCYELYQNGSIYFNVDSEVYSGIFTDYLEGTIELEEMIEEAERKLQMYQKE